VRTLALPDVEERQHASTPISSDAVHQQEDVLATPSRFNQEVGQPPDSANHSVPFPRAGAGQPLTTLAIDINGSGRPLCDIRSFEFKVPKLPFGAMTTRWTSGRVAPSATPARRLVFQGEVLRCLGADVGERPAVSMRAQHLNLFAPPLHFHLRAQPLGVEELFRRSRSIALLVRGPRPVSTTWCARPSTDRQRKGPISEPPFYNAHPDPLTHPAGPSDRLVTVLSIGPANTLAGSEVR
jgi:hypothetical protein